MHAEGLSPRKCCGYSRFAASPIRLTTNPNHGEGCRLRLLELFRTVDQWEPTPNGGQRLCCSLAQLATLGSGINRRGGFIPKHARRPRSSSKTRNHQFLQRNVRPADHGMAAMRMNLSKVLKETTSPVLSVKAAPPK